MKLLLIKKRIAEGMLYRSLRTTSNQIEEINIITNPSIQEYKKLLTKSNIVKAVVLSKPVRAYGTDLSIVMWTGNVLHENVMNDIRNEIEEESDIVLVPVEIHSLSLDDVYVSVSITARKFGISSETAKNIINNNKLLNDLIPKLVIEGLGDVDGENPPDLTGNEYSIVNSMKNTKFIVRNSKNNKKKKFKDIKRLGKFLKKTKIPLHMLYIEIWNDNTVEDNMDGEAFNAMIASYGSQDTENFSGQYWQHEPVNQYTPGSIL